MMFIFIAFRKAVYSRLYWVSDKYPPWDLSVSRVDWENSIKNDYKRSMVTGSIDISFQGKDVTIENLKDPAWSKIT